MKERTITIKHSIFIKKPRELVWDYTQNYDYRTYWDHSIIEAGILQSSPHRIAKLKVRGFTTMIFVYKLDERPHKTSLATSEVVSPIIESAGGYWTYEEKENGTIWEQTNSIILKKNLFLKLLQPVFKLVFKIQTFRAMKRAKQFIENT